MPKESTLKRNVVRLIRDRGGWARSIPQGIHSAGIADIVAVYRRVPLVLETKLPGKERTLTKLQAATLDEARGAGAVARVITSKHQVEVILNTIDRRLDGRQK